MKKCRKIKNKKVIIDRKNFKNVKKWKEGKEKDNENKNYKF